MSTVSLERVDDVLSDVEIDIEHTDTDKESDEESTSEEESDDESKEDGEEDGEGVDLLCPHDQQWVSVADGVSEDRPHFDGLPRIAFRDRSDVDDKTFMDFFCLMGVCTRHN